MAVERTIIDWRMDEKSRLEQRVAVLLKWSEEESGGVDRKQRYCYNVETFQGGGVVYLHRPAFKNKGCDFVVNCMPLIPRDDGRKHKNPRHIDLIQEFKLITQENITLKKVIFDSIVGIYECRDVNDVAQEVCELIQDDNLSIRMERALKVLKWLFIEQDITDWNTSGRAMFMNSIKANF